jgi:hypothetical protein
MDTENAADANIKTVSVQVTAGEEKALSRTRRRKRTPAVQRTEDAQAAKATKAAEAPVANAIQIEKKAESPATIVAPVPIVEPKVEPLVKTPIQLGRKKSETRKSSGTTAAAPGTPGARGNGTLLPKIIYSKKRTVSATPRVQKSPLRPPPRAVDFQRNRKTRRTFRERRIAVMVGGAAKTSVLTDRYTPPAKMRSDLVRAGILRAGSRIPDEKLTRLWGDFRDLKADAL